MGDIILSTDGISKRYKTKMAVDNVSLTINKGDIYGFVGLNGSGKTTFIRLITGLIKPSGGTYCLFGTDKNSDKKCRVSSMVETPSIYLNLTARDNVLVQMGFVNIKDPEYADKILKLVKLENTGKKLAANFSLGMRQRLGIAIALVGEPDFLILDEPTNGLDPEGIIEMRELLLRLNKEMNITILISSHILTELSKLATRYGFIHDGKLLKEVTSEEMFASCRKKTIVGVDDLAGASKLLRDKFTFEIVDNKLEFSGDINISDIFEPLFKANIKINSTENKSDDLEAYFINLIGGVK